MISRFLEIEVNKSKDHIRKVKRAFVDCFSGGLKNWLTYSRSPTGGSSGSRISYGNMGEPGLLSSSPPGYELRKLGHCGRNPSRLALRDPELTYVEGYAVPKVLIDQENIPGAFLGRRSGGAGDRPDMARRWK